jgi:hypothetical protein
MQCGPDRSFSSDGREGRQENISGETSGGNQSQSGTMERPQKEMTYFQEPVFIYGFRDGSRIRYIGQTVTDLRRFDQHKRRNKELAECSPFVIRVTDYKNCARIERQIVLNLKRRGQADLNKRIPHDYTPEAYANPILWVERNLVFASFEQAARHFKTTASTVKAYIAKHGGIDGATLRLMH